MWDIMNQFFKNKVKLNTSVQEVVGTRVRSFDYMPLTVILGYNITTFLVFLYGPWDWPVISYLKINVFMALVFISIYFGFRKGVKKNTELKISNKGSMQLFNIMFYLALIFVPITLISRTGTFFNLDMILNPGQAYMDAYSMRVGGGGSAFVEYARILFSPLLVAFVPSGIFLWKRLSTVKKTVFLLLITQILLTDIQRGTNKGSIDLIIYIIVVGIVSFVSNNKDLDEKKFRKKYKKMLNRLLIVGLILMVLFVSFFQFGMKGRSGGLNKFSANGEAVLNTDHLSLRYFDDIDTQLAIGGFYSYLSQGYYALDLSLNKPFMWTFGLGNSLVVLVNVNNLELMNRTYVYRCETENHWSMMRQWHSFYVWAASDVTFIGVFFLLFLLAYIYGMCWKLITRNNDLRSLILFSQITIMFFYLPMNNQLAQGFETYFGFLFWLNYWIFTRFFIKQERLIQ